MFLAPWFALAGLAAAAGPVVIHLLNRQRYRVVDWAAMDFLREAVRRSRRILRLRDLLLLALRTLCVLLFGLAMARPYLSGSSGAVDPDQPVHAVLVVDNSLSMGYEQLQGTLLDEAKKRAKEFCDRLPPASRISVLPLCGSAGDFNHDAYYTKDDAVEAIEMIAPVDRSARATAAIDLAAETCRRVVDPPAKQVVFFSDHQAANWPAALPARQMEQLPATLQLVRVAADETENAWIADFKLQDGIADLSTPAVFLARVRYQGDAPRHDVQVTLAVDGVSVASETIDLEPGQSREVRFAPYQLDAAVEAGGATFLEAEVSIPHDRLPADDRRLLAVPVVSALPVVFVDQYGGDEAPERNRLGETFRLRRLLAPVASGSERGLIEVRHAKPEEVDRDLLADARLVVMAGVSDPADAAGLLREYCEQGGFLVIAAGADFDPVAWTETAWAGGAGILPAPLEATPVGRLPGASPEPMDPFQLDFQTMAHGYFRVEGASREELEDLYALPYFFKAVEADLSDDVIERMVRSEADRHRQNRAGATEARQRLAELAEKEVRESLGDAERAERERLEQARAGAIPRWLLWQRPESPTAGDALAPEEVAEQARPRVLASFTNKAPFMIERVVGRGRVLFVSTGVFRDWNTLTATNAVLIFDRIFRQALEETLPKRNITSTEQIALPVRASERRARFTLSGAERREEPIGIDALGAGGYGIIVGGLPGRGHYRITAYGTEETPHAARGAKLWEVPVAVNGPADESDLTLLDGESLDSRMGQASYRWIDRGQTIRLAGSPVRGEDLWKWLMVAVLVGLLVELAILVRPRAAGGATG